MYEGRLQGRKLTAPATDSSKVVTEAPALQLPLFATKTAHERRAFEYFFECAAPVFAGALDIEFWRYLIPQLSQSEPIVWDAVLAISTLFEHPQDDGSIMLDLPGERPVVTNEHHQLALRAYSRALSRFRDLSKLRLTALPLAMISCVLFVCIESLQDNIHDALSLLKVGCKLLCSHISTKNTLPMDTSDTSNIGEIAEPIFLRLGCLSAIMGHAPPEDFKFQLSMKDDSNFSTLERARYSLHVMMLRGHKFLCNAADFMNDYLPPGPIPNDLVFEQSRLIAECREWEESFSKVLQKKSYRWTPSEIDSATAFFAWSITYRIWVTMGLSFFKSPLDRFFPEIEMLLGHARRGIASTVVRDGLQPHFIFEMGVIPPLFGVALRCRHPILRREALSLMKQCPRKGGLWKAVPQRRFAEKIIELEEDGLWSQPVTLQTLRRQAYRLPPEEKRIHGLHIYRKDAGNGRQEWHLRYGTIKQNSEGLWQKVEHEVFIDDIFSGGESEINAHR